MRLNPGVMLVDGGGATAPYKPKTTTNTAVQSPGPSDLSKLSPQFSGVSDPVAVAKQEAAATKSIAAKSKSTVVASDYAQRNAGIAAANTKNTVSSPSPFDLTKLAPQVTPKASTKTSVGGSSFASPQLSSYTGTSGFKPERTRPGITKEQLAGGAADLLLGVGSFKSAIDNAKEVFTGKDETGKKVNRLKSAASVVGNTALGATNLVSTAAMIVPVAGAAAKTGVVGLNAAVKGAKTANAVSKGAKVTPATSKAITTAVKAKNAAAEAAAAGSAKVVSAGDVVLESAMKGAQFVGAQTKGKTASGLAAGVIALGPGAAGVSGAGKATTAITQSVNAAKKVTSAADTFVPKAAKSSTKVTSGGAVPNVTKPAGISPGVKAGTSGKVAQAVTAVDAGIKAATGRTVTNNPFYNNNPFNNTDNKTNSIGADSFNPSKDTTAKDTTDSQSNVTTDKSRVNQFNDAIGKGTENKGTENKGTENKGTENKGTENKGKGNKGKGTEIPGTDELPTSIPATDEVPTVITDPNVAPTTTGPGGEGPGPGPGPGPTPPPVRVPTPALPVKLKNDVEEVKRKRKWNPSAIV